jgi:site-specific DNA-cytosine methylase
MGKQIRWGILQPLTGGMYFGTKQATGCDAQWIISFNGLNSPKFDKEGNLVDGGNEYHLTTYLKNHNCMPPYYVFKDRKMFQSDIDANPELITEDGQTVNPDFNDIDIVTAVPVCSGLSTATICGADVKNERNCNMLFLATYTLNVIKPKVYIFENAPTLMSTRGDSVRKQLEELAKSTGYSIAYYKTDTRLHHNCQKRPRTFVYFFKDSLVPELPFENAQMTVQDFLAQIPEDATQKVTLTDTVWNFVPIKYARHIFGINWRDHIDGDLFEFVWKDKEATAKFNEWLHLECNDEEIAAFERYLNHIDEKRAEGKGWWIATPRYYHNFMPACMHKNVFSIVHISEDRLYNMREWLTTMGMPYDFEMQGVPNYFFQKMGQNVPVGTAKFIVEQAVKFVNNELEITYDNKLFYDNTKQKISHIL